MVRLPPFADDDPDERYYDPAFEGMVWRLRQGGCRLAWGEEVLTTLLGSCVAVCLRDPVLMLGGMVHFVLPTPVLPGAGDPAGGGSAEYGAYPYGETAMALLRKRLIDHGAEAGRLEAKLFGGGEVVSVLGPVGVRNIECAEMFMRDYGVLVVASDLGGTLARRVYYQPSSGRAWVRRKGSQAAGDAASEIQPMGSPLGERR